MFGLRRHIPTLRRRDRRTVAALLATLAVVVAAVGAIVHESGARAANRVSPPMEAVPVVLSTLPAAQQALVEETAPPDGAAVDPKGGSWMRLTVPVETPWATKDANEQATYANWLGEVTAAGIQAQLLSSGETGLAGASVQPATPSAFPAGFFSDSFTMGTPDAGAYGLPATGLKDETLLADAEQRALSAKVTLEHIEVLTLGKWKAIAIVARSDADAESTAASWFPVVRALIPIDLHDSVVGYYMALEDSAGDAVHINSTGYLANITSTWTDPDLKTDPGILATPVLNP